MTTEAPVLSPCIKLCVIDPVTKRCRGCERTLDEIASWPRLSDAERRRIMVTLPDRQAARTARR